MCRISWLLALFLLFGCGGADVADNDGAIADFTPLVSVDPPPGATVPSNQVFSLTFDPGACVIAVTVNGAKATLAGLNWTASPPLPLGPVTLIVEWTNRDGASAFANVGPYEIAWGQ